MSNSTLGGFQIRTGVGLLHENVKGLVTGPPKTGKTSNVARAYATYDDKKLITGYRIFFVVIGDATALTPTLVQPLPDGKVVRVPNAPYHVVLDPLSLPGGPKQRTSEAFWAILNELSVWFANVTPQARPFDAVAIDGLNFLGQYLDEEYEKYGPKGWEKWDKLQEFFCGQLIAWATALGRSQNHGLDVWFIGHSSDPAFGENGKIKTRGGVALPTKKLAEQFPGKCDIVLHADTVAVPGSPTAKRTLFTAPDPERVAGDRLHVCQPQEPMDLADIVRRIHTVLGRPTRSA